MRRLSLWLPAIAMGTVIFLSSQLFDVPRYTPLFEFYGHVKTTAHLVLYFGLGFLVARLLSGTLQIGALGVLSLSSALCVAYGASDEFHQMFVAGRTANFFDILRDLVGGTLGALAYIVCAWTVRSFRSPSPQAATGGLGPIFGQALVTVAVSILVTVPTVVFSDSIAPFFRALSSQARASGRTVSPGPAGYALVAAAGETGVVGTPAPPVTPRKPEVASNATPRPAVTPKMQVEVAEKAKKDLVSEVKRTLLTEVADDVSRYGDRSGMGSMVVSAVETLVKGGTNGGKIAGKDTRQILAKLSAANLTPQPQAPQQTQKTVVADFRPELLAVVVNPANPVNALTTDQVRKVFMGEYTNWSQVGGPDVPITVLIVHAGTRDPAYFPENVLKASPSPTAITLRYASFIFPRIDRTKGAVAFVPISVRAQLGFMEKHEAIKLLALRNRPQAPAVMPSRMAINLGSYPMVVDRTTASLAR